MLLHGTPPLAVMGEEGWAYQDQAEAEQKGQGSHTFRFGSGGQKKSPPFFSTMSPVIFR